MSHDSILLVDDQEIILKALMRELQYEGYEVGTAQSGKEAVQKMTDGRYNIVITDLSMPGMDGIAVLKAAKKIDQDIGVIILTGYGDMDSAIEALRSGADDYLLKPCNNDELRLRIHRCLEIFHTKKEKNELERQLQASNDLLELKVKERTIELETTNTALNVLLKKREKDKQQLEEQVLHNFKTLISPYLEKMKASRLTPAQQANLEILESNFNQLTSSFAVFFSAKNYNLSPTELQVANLIALGKKSEEIAALMHIAIETVHNHRRNIRKKLGITKKQVNLKAVLSGNEN